MLRIALKCRTGISPHTQSSQRLSHGETSNNARAPMFLMPIADVRPPLTEVRGCLDSHQALAGSTGSPSLERGGERVTG